MNQSRLGLAGLAGVVLGYLVLGVLYAILTPPWQAPDEPAHYNYIRQIADAGCCPIIAEGDYDFDYLEALKANQFPDDADVSTIEYEDHQPPLYYLLGTPVYAGANGSLTAQRIFSVVIGAGVIILAYLIVRRIFPEQPLLALASSMLVAFIPQHIAIHASVNNDSLAELTLALVILGCIRYLRLDQDNLEAVVGLGALAGLALLTKLTVYLPAVLAVAVAISLKTRAQKQSFSWFLQRGVVAGAVALILGGLWWVRNAITYGFPDITGLAAHDEVVTGQPTTASFIEAQGLIPYVSGFFRTLFNSFWGQFGWMGVPMPRRVYQIILVFLIVAIVGGIILIARRSLSIDGKQRRMLFVLLAVLLATFAGLFIYNLTFAQAQGRYLYPALIPLALMVVLGLYGWSVLIRAWLPESLQQVADWLPVLALIWLPALSLFALFRFVVPNLG